MERTYISSTSVVSIGYDPALQVLEIEYHQGNVYQYQGVPQDVFDQLMGSPSKGAFINDQIKKFYVFVKV